MEIALQNEFAERNVIARKPQTADSAESPNLEEPPFKHEHLGKQILDEDDELRSILEGIEPRIEPVEIHEIFTKVNPPRFANIISSDLDADRIDYLLRNSYHTGLPYGEVDISHILGQMRVDEKDRICLTHKALRSADHLFLGRFFDYQQIPFNKTVVALEAALKDVIGELVKEVRIDGSRIAIAAKINNGSWCNFDDGLILEKIRQLHEETGDETVRTKTASILYRTPAKLVGEVEYIARVADEEGMTKRNFRQSLHTINKEVEGWANKFNIDRSLWYVWTKAGLRLTKDGSR
jgi:HD superfamily phosphohydrolase